jgi:hypothetical protein
VQSSQAVFTPTNKPSAAAAAASFMTPPRNTTVSSADGKMADGKTKHLLTEYFQKHQRATDREQSTATITSPDGKTHPLHKFLYDHKKQQQQQQQQHSATSTSSGPSVIPSSQTFAVKVSTSYLSRNCH